MKRRIFFALLLLGLAGSLERAWGHPYWRDLPPEERRQMRQQMREHWQEERDFHRVEGPRRWNEVPPEDRRRMREEIREQRSAPPERMGRPEGEGRRGWRRE